MENENRKTKLQVLLGELTLKKSLKWFGIFIAISFVVLVIYRIPYVINEEKTVEQIAKIHSSRLTLADITGENLPPNPRDRADLTVAGVDANQNGIRDDVELAIFKKYPHSAKTRSGMLQYALALQSQMSIVILNTETLIATIENKHRALKCIWSVTPRADIDYFTKVTEEHEDFVYNHQVNNEVRKTHLHNFYEYLDSYSVPTGDCDLDLSTLPN